MQSWIVLIPPVITLIIAFISKKVKTSLVLGIFSAALITEKYSILQAIKKSILQTWKTSQIQNFLTGQGSIDTVYMFVFLIILGGLVALMNRTGGACAYGSIIKKKLKDARTTETASLLLSLTLFIDDYLNTLTVGCIMRPLTDTFKIPRVKLAFLIDAMAAPLVILMPVSSWVAVITGQLNQSGVSDNLADNPVIFADPFYTYVLIIPFVFYSFIIIGTCWFVVRRRISFGLMGHHESIAQKTGNLFGGKEAVSDRICPIDTNDGNLLDFFFPIITLVLTVIMGLQYSGKSIIFGGPNNLFKAFQAGSIFPVLFWAGFITLALSLAIALIRKKIPYQSSINILIEGFMLMAPSILILLLAWSFSGLLKDLNTGQYIAHLLIGSLRGAWLPFIFFVTSAIISITIGSSWGTVAIMIPLVIPMLIEFFGVPIPTTIPNLPLFLPSLGAILSGAVAGDHVSPISDTTIMSSTSSGSHHLDHVRTQWGYAIPAFIGTAVAFIVGGFTTDWLILRSLALSLGSGLITCFAILLILNNTNNKS
ncbi:MAG: Na+/H+ antiporter NhaC family protein [Candidatus Babeliales bacterium]